MKNIDRVEEFTTVSYVSPRVYETDLELEGIFCSSPGDLGSTNEGYSNGGSHDF